MCLVVRTIRIAPGESQERHAPVLPTNCSASSGSPGVLHQDMKKYEIGLPEILQKTYLKSINYISEMICFLRSIEVDQKPIIFIHQVDGR